jgi:hypothetical protein
MTKCILCNEEEHIPGYTNHPLCKKHLDRAIKQHLIPTLSQDIRQPRPAADRGRPKRRRES